MSGKHLAQTYSSDCHHRHHHEMQLLFSLAREVPLREPAILPATEQMKTWWLGIQPLLDDQ